MKTTIVQCHGSSNKFIIIDEMKNILPISEIKRKKLSIKLCNHIEKLKCDGILFIQNSDIAACKMRMFNPDGSEAEMCGNGIRCVGRYACESLKLASVSVETMKGLLTVDKVEPIYEGVHTYTTQIGPISFDPQSLPISTASPLLNSNIKSLDPNLKFSAISVPNPHLITNTQKLIISEIAQVGEKANDDRELFPKGINVSYFSLLEKNKIFAITYERGVGITNSCGTAMSACAIISYKLALSNLGKIEVFNRGGKVFCYVSNDTDTLSLKLSGNATFTSTIVLEINWDDFQYIEIISTTPNSNEILSYEKFALNTEKEAQQIIDRNSTTKNSSNFLYQ